ncbi:HNH endonuclease signature motif containing protein [Mycolicibacterium bacteremicum]|uniref:HNH endonuclease signature motif containing protein n=1 Tax=Mycolicibacterium bacteremicum TaxID=564198 RepID=UPI0026EE413C|nr:HNH endonuclease signature motif containing protein [Mycolicibacterium bacteremicum]
MIGDVVGSRAAVDAAMSDRAASTKALLDADFTAFDTAELLALQSAREAHSRRDEAIDHRLLAELMGRATPHEIGGNNWADVLATRMRLSAQEATRRVRRARELAPRQSITGETLDPALGLCAQALAEGSIGEGHVAVIAEAVRLAAKCVDATKCAELEATLVPLAKVSTPETVHAAAVTALYLMNQDGHGPDIVRHKRGITVGKQDADGLTRISGWVDPELAAYLGTVNDTWARPGVNNPEDPDSPTKPETADADADEDSQAGIGPEAKGTAAQPDPIAASGAQPETPAGNPAAELETRDEQPNTPDAQPPQPPPDPSALWEQLPLPTTWDELADRITAVETAAAAAATPAPELPPLTGPAARDSRSLAQRQHDALKAVLRDTIASGRLGHHNGLPVTVVVSTTLAELEAAAGIAVTGTGTLMPMPDLIRLAEHAHHYLVVYRHHTAEPLYLGRTKRLATKAQRLLLYNRDRGCTRPGCTRCANRCQAHHADPSWKNGGRTDAPTLGLGCPPDNQLAELGWTTKIDPTTGRVHWHPPPLMDTGGDTINHHFHPEELLKRHTPNEDEPEHGDGGDGG